MTDPTASEEKAALEWLDGMIAGRISSVSPASKMAVTIKRLLAMPRLPKPGSEEAEIATVKMMQTALGKLRSSEWETAYRALYTELTKPKTKTVEVWRVEFAGRNGLAHIEQRGTREGAEEQAAQRRSEGATCIRVTGPHMQMVPDDA